jgi:hypothetical protein
MAGELKLRTGILRLEAGRQRWLGEAGIYGTRSDSAAWVEEGRADRWAHMAAT